jgi:hypothetical protein
MRFLRFFPEPPLGPLGLLLLVLPLAVLGGGCVTVRPEQRSVLADPAMRFEGDELAQGQLKHALDNREGSTGGGGVAGGGCGCN